MHQRGRAEAVDDGLDGEVEVRTELVHLVDEADARDVVLVRLAPHRLGLRLDALLAVEHGDGAVEDAQGALDLDGEVHVTGGVDDVDLVVVPEGRRRGGRDGDAALLLLLHPVHRRRAVVNFTDLVRDAGVEQDPLGRRRLAGIDVGHDADVADLGQVRKDVECHGVFSRLVSRDVLLRCGSGAGSASCGPRVVPGLPPQRLARDQRRATSGSARRPCWTRPSCGCPRDA